MVTSFTMTMLDKEQRERHSSETAVPSQLIYYRTSLKIVGGLDLGVNLRQR